MTSYWWRNQAKSIIKCPMSNWNTRIKIVILIVIYVYIDVLEAKKPHRYSKKAVLRCWKPKILKDTAKNCGSLKLNITHGTLVPHLSLDREENLCSVRNSIMKWLMIGNSSSPLNNQPRNIVKSTPNCCLSCVWLIMSGLWCHWQFLKAPQDGRK